MPPRREAYSLPKQRRSWSRYAAASSEVRSLAVASNGDRLYAGTQQGVLVYRAREAALATRFASPSSLRIAYQTRCGIRLATPSGKDVTPRSRANECGANRLFGPPVWSPDGTKLAVGTRHGIYELNTDGSDLHLVSGQATATWYGALPGRPSWRPIR
jgi:hypothetical protein